MVRPTQLLYLQREPAPTRPAATLLLLRDTEGGIEVLMTRRSSKASFAPGAYVFPGGGIDAADARPLAHPPEPGYPCYVSVLGELAWVAPRGEPKKSLPR